MTSKTKWQNHREATPNQPMERTPPCCALRRRSSAALGVCQKRALVLLARHASGFRKRSLFPVLALPQRLSSRQCCSLATCVYLAQWLSQSLACAGANSRSEISVCLGRRVPRPYQKVGPRHSNFPSALVSDVLLSSRVCLAQWLNQSFARAPANRRADRAIVERATRALPKPPRSITKLDAAIEASP